MSGIEILGIAASVVQIADLGGKLSVKLFTFSRKIKNADKSIDRVSQDIAATGAILQQLGSELQKDEQLRLCSQEAVSTARNLVDECNKIFVDLNSALDGGKSQTQGSRLVLGWKDRLKFPFLEPQIELLRSNLERLKSSLVVMLNVMIFAEQLRNQEALPILKEQRELIKTLVEDRKTTQKRFEHVLKTISDTPANEEPPNPALKTQSSGGIPFQTMQSSFAVASEINQHQKHVNMEPVSVSSLPIGLSRRKEEIEHHSALVKRLLEEASATHYNIDHGQRHRMHEGILHVHWKEWSPLRKMYDDETLLSVFSSHHPVSRFWQSQLEREVLSFDYGNHVKDKWMAVQAGYDPFAENLPQYPGPPTAKEPIRSKVPELHKNLDQQEHVGNLAETDAVQTAEASDDLRKRGSTEERETRFGTGVRLSVATAAVQHRVIDRSPSSASSAHSTRRAWSQDLNNIGVTTTGPCPSGPHYQEEGTYHDDHPPQHSPYSPGFSGSEESITRNFRARRHTKMERRPTLPQQRGKIKERAPASAVSKPKTTLSERAKYQFEADSEDEEMENEIDANVDALTRSAGRLNLLAKATGNEADAQNKHLQSISMKSDRVEGGATSKTDVVDDLLLKWTNIWDFGKARNDDNVTRNIERLRRIQ